MPLQEHDFALHCEIFAPLIILQGAERGSGQTFTPEISPGLSQSTADNWPRAGKRRGDWLGTLRTDSVVEGHRILVNYAA